MIGRSNWNTETFEVVQQGSKTWTGYVIVWNGANGVHGRKDPIGNSAASDWEQGDTIQLKTCFDEGIPRFILVKIRDKKVIQ